VNDRSLYDRGAATLVASWEQYAGGSDGAAVVRAAGVAAAVFPAQPERAVYNNARRATSGHFKEPMTLGRRRSWLC
jgi:hypothetical protein